MRRPSSQALVIGVALLPFAAAGPAKTPEAAVQQLYAEVVARRPVGIPKGADKEALWPLLSKRLARQLDDARACEADYDARPSEADKPPLPWREQGLFSGPNDRAQPTEVAVQRAEPMGKGTRVLVRFSFSEVVDTYSRRESSGRRFQWSGAVLVKTDGGRFVVDDVELRKEPNTIESRLSGLFAGCDGPRWGG
jgi:hypothetical protein